MQTTLTGKEWGIFNEIIPILPFNTSFEVYAIIAENIVKPKYIDGTGKLDTSKYDVEMADLRGSKVFYNITNYLCENDYFAKVIGEHNNNRVLKLTERGEALVAFGSMDSFMAAQKPSSEVEIIKRVNEIIPSLYQHGEFSYRSEVYF